MGANPEPVASRSDMLFEELLDQVRIEVDSALDLIAADGADARRTCTRDLRFEPGGEALDIIGRIARDKALSGPRRELPRRLLTLYVLAQRELAALFAGAELNAQRLRRGTVVVAAVLTALDPLRRDLQDAVYRADPDERDYLSACDKALGVSREDLCAALLLVPRLEAFARVKDVSAVRAVAPTLSEGEARRIVAFVDGREGSRGEAHRACLDALALRSLMDEHLAGLDELLARQNAPVVAAATALAEASDSAPDTSDRERLEHLLGNIDADRVAYQFVSRRMQKQKDMALVAGLKSLVEELGHVSKGLFSAYRQVVARSRDAAALNRSGEDGDVVQAEELFRQAAAAEVEAERRVVETSDEVCLKALKRMRDGDSPSKVRKATQRLKREVKSRAKPMAVIVAVLLGVSLWINFDPSKSAGPERITYADFASGLAVSDFNVSGSLLHVKVNGWDRLDIVQRRTRAESLGAIAEAKGYQRLLVTEDNDYPAATWNPTDGVKITPAKQTTPLPR